MDTDPKIVIVGAGAAGLMCAIMTARACRAADISARITLLDGAKKIGAKILVAGGGRCNVTHHKVLPKDYAGSSRNSIKKVLKAFSEQDTIDFFRRLGVDLKQEATGKMFPVSDSAQTVLSALLDECERLAVRVVHPWRVAGVEFDGEQYSIAPADERNDPIRADRIVLATGGMALPRTGSDGGGYRIAKSLGHTLTERVFPSLVPLVVDANEHWIHDLSGISARVEISVQSGTGKRLASFTNELLCTHFGLSGPAVLDISRWYLDAIHDDPDTKLVVCWLPGITEQEFDGSLQQLGKRTISGYLRDSLSERLARALCNQASLDPGIPGHSLTKDQRRKLVQCVMACVIEIERDRGFTFAEVTAGGVPLNEIATSTMKSRCQDNLWLIGELLDVDGRIGGFNFQWAWASGTVAGRSIAQSLQPTSG